VVERVLDTIDRDVCDRFELYWLQGNPRPIDELLDESSATDNVPTLVELIALEMEYSWRSRLGRDEKTVQSALPTVEDYLARFPQVNESKRVLRLVRKERDLRHAIGDRYSSQSYAARFPELFEDEAARAFLATVQFDTSETLTDSGKPSLPPKLGEFGDYELLDVIGEGGMGVVYRARQQGANRIVALKVVRLERPGGLLGKKRAKAVERFRTEAQAAARLEHENIVPVYDVGQVGDQLYFAMRFVEGRSLKELVAEQPLENHQAAKFLVGAAEGIAEAHRNGILHRDMKPHNIMVDERNDRAMVADFGIAKFLQSDDELTRSGEILGTPSYMPPEQISNSAQATPASDVYSLGATLYHLLTGRPPFQAPHAISTMRQVIYEVPVAPSRLNAEVDKDLDTICLKCLQKEPGQRYESAEELAEDLRRYTRHEPIKARPLGAVARGVRWSRRNPLPASLAGLATALGVAVFLAVAIGYQQTTAALADAEAHFSIARETVDELYTEVSEIDLKNAPGMQPLKEKLLSRALQYYQRMIVQRGDDADLTAELAMNYFRVGSITSEIGSIQEAESCFVQAAKIQQALLEKHPGTESLHDALGDSWNALGRVRMRTGKLTEAEQAFSSAHAVRKQVAAEHPLQGEYQRKFANIQMNQGLLDARRGQFDRAEEQYRAAQRIRREAIAEKSPENQDSIIRDYGKGAFNLGTLAANRQRYDEAAEDFRLAITQFEPLVDRNPESLSDQLQLAVAYYMLADVLQQLGKHEEAIDHYANSQARLQLLTDDNPQVTRFREEFVTALIGQAQLSLLVGQSYAQRANGEPELLEQSEAYYKQAEQLLLQSAAELRHLRSQDSPLATYHFDLGLVLQMLGDVQLAFHEPDGGRGFDTARQYFEEALEAMEPLATQFDSDPAYKRQWDSIQQSLAQLDEAL
jgi:tetratricopeptide (TPR) repeat protein/predicted Ser/Thr protein kinase